MILSTLAYVDQARSLLFARSSKGFSATSCLLLVIANVLRCLLGFYEGKTLAQLFEVGVEGLMLLPIVIISLFLSIRGGATAESGIESFSTLASVLIIVFFFFGEVVGFFEIKSLFGTIVDGASLFTSNSLYLPDAINTLETLAPVPQVFASLRAGSGSTLSSVLVLMRFFVDLKRVYFYTINSAPRQLALGGQIQLACSTILFLQAYLSGSFLRLALRIPIAAARILSYFASFFKPRAKANTRGTESRKKEESAKSERSFFTNPFRRSDETKEKSREEEEEEVVPVAVAAKRPSLLGAIGGRLARILGVTILGVLKRVIRLALAGAFILAQTVLIASLSFLSRVKAGEPAKGVKSADSSSKADTAKGTPATKPAMDNSKLMNRSVTFSV